MYKNYTSETIMIFFFPNLPLPNWLIIGKSLKLNYINGLNLYDSFVSFARRNLSKSLG